jgi:uncharacterized protein
MHSNDYDWRQQVRDYIRLQAQPPDKYSHQPRLYALACKLGTGMEFDDDILFAACWLHDLGVFIGHRPEEPEALARWDNVAYAIKEVPALLVSWGFPPLKIPAVQDAIRQHHPQASPVATEAILLHDADLLELLGAVGLLRTVSKVGRDTRFQCFSDLLPVLEKYRQLPPYLLTEAARVAAQPRVELLQHFLQQAAEESQEIPR